jgi:hypothetical protein
MNLYYFSHVNKRLQGKGMSEFQITYGQVEIN